MPRESIATTTTTKGAKPLHLSTAEQHAAGSSPWLNIESARWLRIQSALTVEGIAGPAPEYSDSGTARQRIHLDHEHPHTAALALIQARIVARLDGRRIAVIAHRVVHGGSRYFEPTLVTAGTIAELRALIPLAPLHQPFPLKAMSLLFEQWPGIVQVACFDTAFHRTAPKVEQILPLPYSAWERGLRRYGFHGLSYDYMSHVLPERHGDLARGRTIVEHLGSGASLCAMQNLQSVATTMGFSALDGLMMGTRTGSLDPGAASSIRAAVPNAGPLTSCLSITWPSPRWSSASGAMTRDHAARSLPRCSSTPRTVITTGWPKS